MNFTFKNSTEKQLPFVLEPLGDTHELQVGEKITLTIKTKENSEEVHHDVEVEDGAIAVILDINLVEQVSLSKDNVEMANYRL